MSFNNVKSRVLGCLSKTKIIQLESEVARRISSKPLAYLDGSGITDADRFKIFKHSLISIYPKREDAEYNSALHLIKTILDCFSCLKGTEVEALAPCVMPSIECKDIKSSNKREKVKRTARKQSKEVSRMSVVHDAPISEPLNLESVEFAMETGVLPANVEIPPLNTQVVEQEVPVVDPLIPAHRKSKRKKVRGSATPGTPSNKKFAESILLEDPRGKTTDFGDEDVWGAHWSQLAGLISAQDVPKILEGQPRSYGISCRADKLLNCSDCISTVLSLPFTSCEAAGCKNANHIIMGLHTMSEFDIQSFHDGKVDILDHLVHSMHKCEVLPSLHYVMLHDRTARKVKPLSTVASSLRKCVDTYQSKTHR